MIKFNISIFSFIACAFGVISKRRLLFQDHEDAHLHLYFLQRLVDFTLTLLVDFCKCYKAGIQINSFACGYLVVQAPFVETILSLLNGLGTLVKNQLAILVEHQPMKVTV